MWHPSRRIVVVVVDIVLAEVDTVVLVEVGIVLAEVDTVLVVDNIDPAAEVGIVLVEEDTVDLVVLVVACKVVVLVVADCKVIVVEDTVEEDTGPVVEDTGPVVVVVDTVVLAEVVEDIDQGTGWGLDIETSLTSFAVNGNNKAN